MPIITFLNDMSIEFLNLPSASGSPSGLKSNYHFKKNYPLEDLIALVVRKIIFL